MISSALRPLAVYNVSEIMLANMKNYIRDYLDLANDETLFVLINYCKLQPWKTRHPLISERICDCKQWNVLVPQILPVELWQIPFYYLNEYGVRERLNVATTIQLLQNTFVCLRHQTVHRCGNDWSRMSFVMPLRICTLMCKTVKNDTESNFNCEISKISHNFDTSFFNPFIYIEVMKERQKNASSFISRINHAFGKVIKIFDLRFLPFLRELFKPEIRRDYNTDLKKKKKIKKNDMKFLFDGPLSHHLFILLETRMRNFIHLIHKVILRLSTYQQQDFVHMIKYQEAILIVLCMTVCNGRTFSGDKTFRYDLEPLCNKNIFPDERLIWTVFEQFFTKAPLEKNSLGIIKNKKSGLTEVMKSLEVLFKRPEFLNCFKKNGEQITDPISYTSRFFREVWNVDKPSGSKKPCTDRQNTFHAITERGQRTLKKIPRGNKEKNICDGRVAKPIHCSTTKGFDRHRFAMGRKRRK